MLVSSPEIPILLPPPSSLSSNFLANLSHFLLFPHLPLSFDLLASVTRIPLCRLSFPQIFCRRRKLRCNGHHPTCSNCLKAKQVCEYDGKGGKGFVSGGVGVGGVGGSGFGIGGGSGIGGGTGMGPGRIGGKERVKALEGKIGESRSEDLRIWRLENFKSLTTYSPSDFRPFFLPPFCESYLCLV